jgi:hypothetical protein
MIRTVFTPNSNVINFPIPDKYIGTKLELMLFPVEEVSEVNVERKEANDIDLSFGAWADMDKSTEEICAEIRNSRIFRKRDIVL